jgi:GAF domain-containing protein
VQRFEQGEPIYGIVRQLPEQEQAPFAGSGILSLIWVPIMIGRLWWGYIGFDDCRTEREWSPNEIDALRTAANLLSSAIQREQATDAVQSQLRELTMLHSVALASSSASDLDELVQSVTNIIGDTLVPDNYGVLLLTPGGGALRPHRSYAGTDKAKLDEIVDIGRGITGRAALTGQPVRVDNVRESQDYVEISPGIRAELCVPILSAGALIGVINLESRQAHAFSESDERLMSTVAGTMGTAIERLRLFDAQRRRTRESDSLREATSALTRSLDLPTLLEITLDLLTQFAPFDSASIMLKEPDESMFIAAVRGLPEGFLGRKFGPASEMMQRGSRLEPVIIGDVWNDERFERVPGTEYIRGWMGVPLVVNEELIGLLNLDSRTPDAYTQERAVLVQTFANQAAVAIQNARLFESEQLRRQEAENLRVAASAITSSLDSKQVLETILVALKQVVPYDSASMLLLDGDMVRITAAKGLPFPGLAVNQTFPATNRLLTAIHATGQPLILQDAQQDARFENWAAGDKIHGWMGVPLLIRGQIIGFITLDSYTTGSFDERSASLAQTFAHQAAAAIDNARLFGETRRRLEEMEIVSRISFGVRTARDADAMLPILFSEVLNIMGTDTGSVWLYDEGSGMLVQKIAAGWNQNVPVTRLRPGEGIAGHVFRSGDSYQIPDFVSDPHGLPENRKTFEPGWNGIALPIRTSNEPIGAMLVAVPNSRRVEAHQVQLLTVIAEIAGNAIHRINLYARSEEQVRRLIALRDVDMAIAGSFDLKVTLNILLDHIVSQLRVDAAAIQAFNPDMQILSPLANLGFRRQANAQATLRISEGPASKILIDRHDVHIYDADRASGFRRQEQLAGEGFVSYYATPLVSKGQTKGVLETFFRRPFNPDPYWLEFLHAMSGQAAIAIDNAQLFENLQRSNQELSLAYDTTLEGWGKALELRDKETQGHTQRVTDLTVRLARRLGLHESELTHIRRGVLLHDIGKMGVPDQILKKAGPLTEAEWDEMRRHPKYAYDLLYPIAYLRPALDIPYYHHERWDGSGYPRGLQGEDIPLAARIFAVVDVWDALLYDRPYRAAWPREDVIEYIRARAGSRFDPAVVTEFLRMIGEGDGPI